MSCTELSTSLRRAVERKCEYCWSRRLLEVARERKRPRAVDGSQRKAVVPLDLRFSRGMGCCAWQTFGVIAGLAGKSLVETCHAIGGCTEVQCLGTVCFAQRHWPDICDTVSMMMMTTRVKATLKQPPRAIDSVQLLGGTQANRPGNVCLGTNSIAWPVLYKATRRDGKMWSDHATHFSTMQTLSFSRTVTSDSWVKDWVFRKIARHEQYITGHLICHCRIHHHPRSLLSF